MNKWKFLLVFVAAAIGLAAGPGHAQGICQSVDSPGMEVVDFTNFRSAGIIYSGLLQGTFVNNQDPGSFHQVTSEAAPPVEAQTLSYTSTTVFTTSQGTLTTRNFGVGEPVPNGRAVQVDRVIAGTGAFEGASGFVVYDLALDASASLDSPATTVTFTGHGEICLAEAAAVPAPPEEAPAEATR